MDRQRIQTGPGHPVPTSVKFDRGLRPELFEEAHLLLAAIPPRLKVRTQGAVFLGAGTDTDAETQTPAGQHVQFRGLLGDQHGLARGQDNDRGHQFYLLRDGRHIGQQRQRLVHITTIGPENLIRDAQMRIAQLIRRLGKRPDRSQIALKLPHR